MQKFTKSDTKTIKSIIDELLNKYRNQKGVTEYTHVSMGGVTLPGKFNFTDKKDKDRLNKYIAKAADEGIYYSIAEKIKKYAPIMVDIDLRYPKDQHNGDRLYNDSMIHNIIKKYRDGIMKYLNVNNKMLNCMVFEKPSFGEKNNEVSDGIHLIFPDIVASDMVRHLVYKYVSDECASEDTFTHYCNASDVLDSKIISSNPWLIYGCCKPSSIPYKLTRVLDDNNNIMDLGIFGDRREITNLLSLRSSKWSESNATNYNINITDDIITSEYNDIFSHKDDDKVNEIFDDIIPTDKLELVEKCIALMDMLSDKRADRFHEWVRIGWSLHNTHKCLLDTWIQFSKRSRKYKAGECEKMWKSMKDDGYTIRSIMLWAKEDNPEEYKKFIKEDFENNLKKNSINNTFMIAKALYCKYFDKFVCANPKENIWYQFIEHRWRKCPNGGRLITLISSEFANHYIEMAQECNKKALESNTMDKKRFLEESTHFNKIAECLMDINFKEKIMKEARYLFNDEMFIKRLDENPNLIGFENGVYDLKDKKFRRGHPDDHISMSTNTNYTKWSDANPYANQIYDFFEKILPNKNVRDYFLSRLSTCVSGENKEEKFYFCTGSGSNGKSLCFQLVSEGLGDYYISCPITIITRKRGASNAASPELARMKGARIGVFQEPGTDETINVGIFKEISGNDKFMVRGLYQDPIEVKSQMKNWMTTNELPEINSDDGGTWRRLRVINFGSKFVENPDPLNPNEFMLDDSLKSKISSWAGPFVSYLIHIFTTLYDVPNKVPEPIEVQLSTNQYRKDQDLVREYYDTMLEITEDKNDGIKKKELFSHFKGWFRDLHEGETLPKSKKLYDFMEKEIKHKYLSSSGWPFLKFKRDAPKNNEENNMTGKSDLDLD